MSLFLNTNESVLRVLILKDAKSDVRKIRKKLESTPYNMELYEAASQKEYLDMLYSNRPSIIFSVYSLHGYNATMAHRDMKKICGVLPFILIDDDYNEDHQSLLSITEADAVISSDKLHTLPKILDVVLEKHRAGSEFNLDSDFFDNSEKWQQAAERIIKSGYFQLDADKREIVCSAGMYELLEVNQKDFIFDIRMLLAFIHPEHLPSVMKVVSKINAGSTDQRLTIKIVLKPDVCKVINLVLLSNGKMAGKGLRVFVSFQDVSLQYESESKLRELTTELEMKVDERIKEFKKLNATLQEQNKHINAGLRYAKLIQTAALPRKGDIKKYFKDSFVLWVSKDQVSGDFFWHTSRGKFVFIAAVDCTGHGIPASLLSMVANQLLHQIINEKNITEPDEILSELDLGVRIAMHQESESAISDGMDIGLCRIDSVSKTIIYSGAKRPLFYCNRDELTEFKGDIFPIGSYQKMNLPKTFNQYSIQYETGACIFLTTDGYTSQFGGKKGRTIMKKDFLSLLDSISNLSSEEQYKALCEYHISWKGKEEQVDDILVIGIRL